MRKTISVNDPLRYGGITIYQTDWSFSALQILKDDEGPFNLAMAPLQINGDKKLYGTFLPIGDINSHDVKGMYVSFISTCNLWKSLVFVSLLENHLAFSPMKRTRCFNWITFDKSLKPFKLHQRGNWLQSYTGDKTCIFFLLLWRCVVRNQDLPFN